MSKCSLAGRHCCLWCNITKEGMKIPLKERGRSENRTLEKLQNFNHMFVQSGAKLSEAKNFYNVIADALFNIPIDQVCIKYLLKQLICLYTVFHLMYCTWLGSPL